MQCRLCLVDDSNLMEIFGAEGKSLKVAKLLNKYFSYISLKESTAPCICKNCWESVSDFENFCADINAKQDGFESTENMNWQPLMEQVTEDIKQEVVYESDNFEHVTLDNLKVENLNQNDRILALDPSRPSKRKRAEKRSGSKPSNEWEAKREKFLLNISSMDCLECSTVKFATWQDLSDHYTSAHQMTGFVVCRCCNRKFTERDEALSHAIAQNPPKPATRQETTKVRRSHSNAFYEANEEKIRLFCKFECDMCPTKFKNWKTLKLHYMDVHKIEGYVTCSCCEKKFTVRYQVLDHVLYQTDPEQFKCKYCGTQSKTRYAHEIHVSIHEPEKYKRHFRCTICPDRTFRYEHLLTEHMTNHLPDSEKKFQCGQCHLRYHTEKKLKQHEARYHPQDSQKFVKICDACGKNFYCKAFYDRHYAKVHLKLERKKVQCHHCDKWILYEYMVRHLRINHRNNTIENRTCTICGKVNSSLQSKLRHIRLTHKPAAMIYNCHLCDRSFAEKIMYNEHIAVHNGVNLYTCYFCPKTFRSNANMYKHFNQLHKEEWEARKKKT